ncbi:MAG: beta-propeller domain-containing protein [Thermoplasmata archaeon]
MKLLKEDVSMDDGEPKKMALIMSGIVALSVFAPLAIVFGLNATQHPSGLGGLPEVSDYEGLLITVPSSDSEALICQEGELVTQLPLEEIKRYLPLEQEQDFLNKHPWSFSPESDYPLTVSPVAFGELVGDVMPVAFDTEATTRTPAPRDIEEADIVRLVGDTYFVLNPYRGLLIVDVANPDEPELLGRARVYGEPVEMFIVDSMAYLIVKADYGYWYGLHLSEKTQEVCDFNIGSQIIAVDVSDFANPEIVQKFHVPGFVQDTRRVGNVIYAVSNEHSWYGMRWEGATEDKSHIVSFDISDPTNITEIQRLDFNGSYNQIHITEQAIFVAQPTSGDWFRESARTRVVYVDVSHPGGLMKLGGSYEVGGWLEDRYQIDYYDGTLRLVTHYRRGTGESELWILDVSDPSDIELLGNLLIDDAGTLMATRFAEDRAYTIHLPRRVDPLDVVDLSDPADPKLTDVLEIPGWITHMEVRGHKILALGVDDTSARTKVALSLFDVSDPYHAVLLDRVAIGNDWSWSSANLDPKTLSVLDDLNMALVPITSRVVDENGYTTSANAVQIVDFDLTSGELEVRGMVYTPASVTRTRHHAERILATSDRTLQVIDFADRDNPGVTAVMELTTRIMDYVVIGDRFVRLVRHDSLGGLWLETVDSAGNAMASIRTGMGWGDLLVNEQYIYIVGYEHRTPKNVIKIFDYSDPTNPELGGEYELSDGSDACGGPGIMWGCFSYYSFGSYVPALEDGYLVYYYADGSNWLDETSGYTLEVIDLSDPADPGLASTLQFNAHMIMNPLIDDGVLYYTDVEHLYETNDWGIYESSTRDSLGRISLANTEGPETLPNVDIPGMMLAVEGGMVYTLADYGDEGFQTLNVLEVENDEATVLLAVRIDGYVNRLIVEDGIAYVGNSTGYWYMWDYEQEEPRFHFVVMDLRDVENPAILGTFETSEQAYLQKVEGECAFLRSSSGRYYIFHVGEEPSFFGLYLSNSWVTKLRVLDGRAFFIEGYYGVDVVDLP